MSYSHNFFCAPLALNSVAGRQCSAQLKNLKNLVCYILAQKCVIGVTRERAKGKMGGKTGELGEGPAGATVPYHVRGLHAARGANWTAPRGDIR